MTEIKYLEKLLNLAFLFYFIFLILFYILDIFCGNKKNLLGFILFCIYHFIPKINIIESFLSIFTKSNANVLLIAHSDAFNRKLYH